MLTLLSKNNIYDHDGLVKFDLIRTKKLAGPRRVINDDDRAAVSGVRQESKDQI